MRGWCTSLLGLGLLLPLGLRGQATAVPLMVAIAVQPAPGRAAGEYLRWVSQPVGKALDREAIRRSLEALYATGDFEDVKAVTFAAPGGERLEFETTPHYFVGNVEVTGGPEPATASELEDATGLDLGAVYDPSLVTVAVGQLQVRLRAYGYYQARVRSKVTKDATTGLAAIGFAITAGARVRTGRVEFSGETLFPAATLLTAAHLRTGKALSRTGLDTAVRDLQAFYGKQNRLTANVTLAAQDYVAASNQLNVRLAITPGPRVEVATEGMALSRGTLEREVPIFQEHAADAELVEEGRANLLGYLQGRGYFDAAVDDRQTNTAGATDAAGELRIVYVITPGAKQALDAVRFSGNQYFSNDDLSDRISIRPATALPDWVPGARGEFSNTLLRGDVNAILRLYHANGFTAAQVTPQINRAYEGRAGHLEVTFAVTEGRQTRVHAIAIEGVTAGRAAALETLLTTTTGQPYAAVNLATDRDAILTYYYNAGYATATCDSAATAVAAGAGAPPSMDVTFTVSEGAQQTVHQVLITGDRFVRRAVIEHDLHIAAGQPLSQSAMLDSQRDLYDSGLFNNATVVARNPNGTDLSKDVLVGLSEASRYTFSEGVGLQVQSGTGGAAADVLGQTGYSPLLSFDATRIGVGGRDQTLSLRSLYSTLQKRAVLGYDMPDFLDHSNLKGDLTALYDDSFDVRTFRAIQEQGGLEVEQRVNPAVGWTYSVDYRHVQVLDPLVAPQEIPVLSQPVQVGEVVVTYFRDHRDDPVDSHRGTYNSVQVGVAKSFGNFADFSRILYQNTWHHPLGRNGKYVLARSTQVGVELPFGAREDLTTTDPLTGATSTVLEHVIPLPERFLSGGPNSLRGFSINQAGPRDAVTGFPVGGNALFLNNVEFRFPMIGTTIGGVLFYDLGNVYTTPGEMLKALPRLHPLSATNVDFTSHTLGAGIRYKTPVGPVSLDTGYLLNPPTFQYFDTSLAVPAVINQRLPSFHFFFSIGQTF